MQARRTAPRSRRSLGGGKQIIETTRETPGRTTSAGAADHHHPRSNAPIRAGDHLPKKTFLRHLCGRLQNPIIRAGVSPSWKRTISLPAARKRAYFLSLSKSDELDAGGADRSKTWSRSSGRTASCPTGPSGLDRRRWSRSARCNKNTRPRVILGTFCAKNTVTRTSLQPSLPGRAWAFQPMLNSPKGWTMDEEPRLPADPRTPGHLSPGSMSTGKKAGMLRGPEWRNTPSPFKEGRITAAGFMRNRTRIFIALSPNAPQTASPAARFLAYHQIALATQKVRRLPDFRLPAIA